MLAYLKLNAWNFESANTNSKYYYYLQNICICKNAQLHAVTVCYLVLLLQLYH